MPCPVCSSESHTCISRMDRRLKPLRTVVCDDCGVFYSNPMPTRDELANYYRNEYRRDYQFALFRPTNRHVQKKRLEAKRRYHAIRSELKGDRLTLLDFGCGSGELVQEYARHGHAAHGFEPGADYASFAQRDGCSAADVRNADLENVAYESRQFDAISMLHVLEHISNPISALRRACGWLKDDGILYIEVPNMQRYSLKGFERFHFAHVIGFSRDNLILALRLAGLRVRRELNQTSLLAEKAISGPCVAQIDLKGTAERNRRDYGGSISFADYIDHHVRRTFRRALMRMKNR